MLRPTLLVLLLASPVFAADQLPVVFEENFEKGMQMFIETRKIEIPILLREMSAYLLELLGVLYDYLADLEVLAS